MGNKKSPEVAIEELKELLREKEELRDVIAEKIEKLVEELEGRHPHPHDPALHRIITGFTHFKFNVFE
ncbi:carbonic anhydrase 2-like [Senna tora]|uniref:Carbonic anhydrase 2-like n=1 Tax=Senna tora TaxID=362788 RepID=A0A835CDI8_9FABA|nr:carbonic anhydrase 2-like [Senna tora]